MTRPYNPSSLVVLTVLVLSGWLCATASPAQAQVPAGIATPASTPVTRVDATSLTTNPGNLSLLQGLRSTVLVHAAPESERGTDAGFFLGYGTHGGAGVGMSVERIALADPYTRVGFGLGFGNKNIAIGWRLSRFFSAFDLALDRFRTSDLGLVWRANNHVGIGAVLRNVGRARLGGAPVARGFDGSIGVRTTEGALSMDVTYALNAAPGEADLLRTNAYLRLVDGLALYAGLDLTMPSDAHTFGVAGAGGGVQWNVGPSGILAGVHANLEGDNGSMAVLTAASFGWPMEPQVLTTRNTLLRIDLSGEIPEHSAPSIFGPSGRQLTDILLDIRRIARDDEMAGVYLSLSGVTSGGAQLSELRRALDELQEAGKLVVVYLDRATIRDLYLAGGADLVVVPPSLSVMDTGISTTRTYIGALLERFDLDATFVRIGDYKSGTERFTNSGPSDEANEQLFRYVDHFFAELRSGVGTRASMSEDEVDALLDGAPLSAETLVEFGIADVVAFRDELPRVIQTELGRSLTVARHIGPHPEADRSWFAPRVVAVLHVSGNIVSGQGGPSFFSQIQNVGSTAFADACREIRADPSIVGVILRIDSPGGSAIASEEMHRALVELGRTKPIVVSMGDIAASGGYYVAAIDAPVFASEVTLTGSIGIYAGSINIERLLSRFGVERVRDTWGGPSAFYTGRPWTDDDVERVHASISAFYDLFLQRVADARGMTVEDVDGVAQGRIWSGTDAVEHALVDENGGFLDAYDEVLRRARVSPHQPIRVAHYPRRRGLLGLGIGGLVAQAFPETALLSQTQPDWVTLARALGLTEVLSAVEQLLVVDTPGDPVAGFEWVIDWM